MAELNFKNRTLYHGDNLDTQGRGDLPQLTIMEER